MTDLSFNDSHLVMPVCVFAEDDDFNFGNNKSSKETEEKVTQENEEGASGSDDDNKGSSEVSTGIVTGKQIGRASCRERV